MEYTRSCWT